MFMSLHALSREKMSSFRCFTLTLDRETEDWSAATADLHAVISSQCSPLTSLGIDSKAEYLLVEQL